MSCALVVLIPRMHIPFILQYIGYFNILKTLVTMHMYGMYKSLYGEETFNGWEDIWVPGPVIRRRITCRYNLTILSLRIRNDFPATVFIHHG